MGKIIGIDLGTTNSVVAIMEGKEPKVIANEEGGRLTPSVVGFDEKGEVLVGQIAKRQSVTNPTNTVYSAKRFMGRRLEEVTEETKRVPYKVTKGKSNDVAFDIRGKQVSPPEVAAKVLQKLKKAAEDYLGEKVTEAVITVPAYFNDAQRQATKDAGRIAGLDVKRIVNEPTAAALAYGLDKKNEEVIAVYDFGGGTFDISILEVGDNVVQVISTNGDTHLGGDDIDNRLMDWLIAEFKKDSGIDVGKDKMVLQRLKAEQHADHRFDLNAKTPTSQWHWLLDMSLGHGKDAKVPMAGWNPKLRRIDLGWCGPRDTDPAKGTIATRVVSALVEVPTPASTPATPSQPTM